MEKKKIAVKNINAADFKPFGWVIEYPGKEKASKNKNLWKVIVRQPKLGWRIAYLVVRDKGLTRLEQHPESLESFEPVCGRGLLYVATQKNIRAIKCFLLDKPVILKKGVWHGVITLTKDFDVKITENSKVKCVYWHLEFKLGNR